MSDLRWSSHEVATMPEEEREHLRASFSALPEGAEWYMVVASASGITLRVDDPPNGEST